MYQSNSCALRVFCGGPDSAMYRRVTTLLTRGPRPTGHVERNDALLLIVCVWPDMFAFDLV